MNVEIMTLGGTKRALYTMAVDDLRARMSGPVLMAAGSGQVWLR